MLIFEIYAKDLPWSGVSNMIVAQKVLNGERLDETVAGEPAVQRLMRRCWSHDVVSRPTMDKVMHKLFKIMGKASTTYGDVPDVDAVAGLCYAEPCKHVMSWHLNSDYWKEHKKWRASMSYKWGIGPSTTAAAR